MECDSIHALIERKLKRRLIHLPSEYISIILEARKNPMPLDVCQMYHDQFLDFDDKTTFVYSSIRPGKRTHEPTVSNLRAIKYTPEGKIFYKLNFDDNYMELDQRAKECNKNNFTTRRLFKERLKIKFSKWQHLQQLKPFLPQDTHIFYDSLPHYEN